MKKKIITVDISAKELKKKLDIKDGYTPIKGVDYFDGENGKDAIVDTENIALEASKLTLEKIKPSIPTIEQIEKDIPKLGEPIRDSLELLQGSERLDKKAILGLEDYDEISKLAREKSKKQTVISGGGARQFTALTDVPNSYSGQAGKFPKVKATEDGLEFDTVDLSGYVPYTGATSDVNLGTHDLITDTVRASTSAGLLLESANGTDIGLLGADDTADVNWYGAHAFSLMTEGSVAYFGTNGLLSQDNNSFNYNAVSKALNIFSTLTERVTNGSFTGSAAGWTLSSGWAYSSNSVSKTSNGTGVLSQSITTFNGAYYKLTYTISNHTVGTVTPVLAGVTLTTRSANGTYTEYAKAINSSAISFTPSNTARMTIDSVSVMEMSGGSVNTGNLYSRELIIGNSTSNSTPGTTRHVSLRNQGSFSYIDAYFGNNLGGAIRFDSSQYISLFAGSAGGVNFYNGLSSPGLSAYLVQSSFVHYGVVAGNTGVAAGNTSPSQPATLTSWGSTGMRHVLLRMNTTLDASYTYVDADANAASSCGGTITYACSHWTTEGDCLARDAHGGCSWSGGECSIYNGDESGCTGQSGCTWEMADCSSFGDEGSCTSQSGCSWNNTPNDCSGFEDEMSCNSYSPDCTWNYTECSSSFYDEESCNMQAGCSWDGMTCNGQFNTYCSGTYYSYSCDGSYPTGNCTGTYGNCSGTSACGGIDDSTNCNNEAGCTWATGLTLTMPADTSFSINFLRTYFIRNIGSSANLTVIPNSGQTINSTTSITIAAGKARHLSLAYHQISCTTWNDTDSTTCQSGHTGCVWTGCSGLGESECLSAGGQCSWDYDTTTCNGIGNCAGTWTVLRDWSVYGGVF